MCLLSFTMAMFILLCSGRAALMKLEDAPKILNKKYYNKYRGKEVNEYEWTVLKRSLLAEIEELDKEFKRSVRKIKPVPKGARRAIKRAQSGAQSRVQSSN